MVVYADILVLVNGVVDYFLLRLCAGMLHRKIPIFRQIAAAGLAGLSSLILFLPDLSVWLNLLLIGATGAVVCLAAFGFKSAVAFGRAVGLFFGLTLLWGGAMFAVWSWFHPHGMAVQNGMVYFNVSPLFLIGFSAAAYLVMMLLQKIFRKEAPAAQRCEVTVFVEEKQITVCAIADTGHSLQDGFGLSEIIVADRAAVETLFGADLKSPALQRRYRLLPCTTVGGEELLEGVRCDRAVVRCGGREVALHQPILARAKAPIGPDYSAVINAEILV